MDARQYATWASAQQAVPRRDVKTFTPTWSGFSVDPVTDLSYVNLGTLGLLFTATTAGESGGTSDATNFSFTGLPDEITPEISSTVPCFLRDNGATVYGFCTINFTGEVSFGIYDGGAPFPFDASGWTSSGNKGLAGGWFVIFPL
jgi:hypothetical protein